MLLMLPADFFSKLTFSKKNLPGTPSELQTVWIQIRTDILSVLIWVQTVCKGYQQMTIVVASKARVKKSSIPECHSDIWRMILF